MATSTPIRFIERPTVAFSTAIFAGVCGGIAMGILALLVAAMAGTNLLEMPARVAAVIVGPGAVAHAGPGFFVLGGFIHLVLSALFGLIYGIVVNATTHEMVYTGAGYGFALFLFNFFVAGGAIPNASFITSLGPLWIALVTHIVYGLVTGLVARTGIFGQPAAA